MLLRCFSVHDNKARAFLPPFFMMNKEMAIRTFAECANDPGHMFCKHGTDFTLFEIGYFDDAHGTVTPLSENVNLGLAAQYREVVVPIKPAAAADEIKEF